MMLLPPEDTVVLFPATTRYDSPGGGTETSTERRIIFSPEVAGRRVGSAKPEWEVFGEAEALEAGWLRTVTRAAGLSLGDRACLALARREALPVVTADRAWQQLALDVPVELIR